MKSNQKAHSYSPEFRESAVKLAIENDQPKAATARELGINVNTLHTWINKYHQADRVSPQPIDDMHLYDQLKELKKENKKLMEERDILKKAAGDSMGRCNRFNQLISGTTEPQCFSWSLI